MYFESPECARLLHELFWFCLLHIEERPEFFTFKSGLLSRISRNYFDLFLRVPSEHRDLFFDSFYDCAAQAVYYSMFLAFPKSRSKLNTENYKQKIFSTVSELVTGIAVSSQSYNRWELILSSKNVLAPALAQCEFSTVLQRPRRGLVHLHCSPLMQRYLDEKRYQVRNSVPARQMKYTFRNTEREKQSNKKFLQYRIDSEKHRKEHTERESQFRELSARLREEARGVREVTNKAIALIESKAQVWQKKCPKLAADRLLALSAERSEAKQQRTSIPFGELEAALVN